MAVRENTPVTIAALRLQLEELIARTHANNEHFVVEQDGQKLAMLVPVEEFEQLQKAQEKLEIEENVRRFEASARAIGEDIERQGLTEEDVEATVEAVRQRLYDENYGR